MAHYAILDENNIVINVITGRDEDELINGEFVDWEEKYLAEIISIHPEAVNVKRTSYNTQMNTHLLDGTPFRGNYAEINGTYDEVNDVFIPPQPFNSWTLNEDKLIWEPPFDRPREDENSYFWDEELYQSDNTQGWVLQEGIE